MKSKEKDWFDSHLIVTGIGLSKKDEEFIKDSIKKECAKPIAKLGKGKKKKGKK